MDYRHSPNNKGDGVKVKEELAECQVCKAVTVAGLYSATCNTCGHKWEV